MKTGTWILATSCVLAAAIGIERAFAARRSVGGETVERLIPTDRLGGRTVAAFSIESEGTRFLYLRAKGIWRCREAFGAVCDASEAEAFVNDVLETRGVVACLGSDCVERARLDESAGLRISVHGSKVLTDPALDVIAAVRHAPLGAGPFAAWVGEDRVLAVDRDPRAHLDARGRPAPLVDTRVLAGTLPAGFAGFARIFVDSAAGSVELASESATTADGTRTWTMTAGDVRRTAMIWRVGGYVSMWVRLRYESVVDPRSVAALGLEPPYATITLAPNTGAAFEVRVSAPDASNGVHVWNRATNVVVRVRAESLPLLVPSANDFVDEAGANPWEAWLAPR